MLSRELTDQEKLDRVRALVPAKAWRIKFTEMAKATPKELMQMKAGLEIFEALYEFTKALIRKRKRAQ